MSQEAIKADALRELARLGGGMVHEDDVIFEGTKFILPANLKDLHEAVEVLDKRAQDEEQVTSFSRTFKYRPWDGAAAVARAMRTAFGFSIGKPIRTMFGSRPPQMIAVNDGPNSTVEVPWGALEIPGLKNATLYLGTGHDADLGAVFAVNVECPKKYRDHIKGLFVLIEEELEHRSIYRGHAIDGATMPNFLDLSAVDPADVVYTEDVMAQLEANVWSPIRHAAQLEAIGQPGKRSVLFEGPYGTGKTLGAYLTAKVAVENGWTFILCRPGRDDLMETLQTARMYQPSVVFFEDLDTVSSQATSETDHVSRILDNFDGIQTKGLKMLLVLTTNHVERIHKGMIRPGRLDAVINIAEMDRPGVERLVKRIVGSSLSDGIDFDAVYAAYEGFMPAFVREAIDRAVRYSVAANDGRLSLIETRDLVEAARGLRRQLQLMEGAKDDVPESPLDAGLRKLVKDSMDQFEVHAGGDLFGELRIPGSANE
jgi:transitional endoplasmic reticulum ATPase